MVRELSEEQEMKERETVDVHTKVSVWGVRVGEEGTSEGGGGREGMGREGGGLRERESTCTFCMHMHLKAVL